MSEPRSHAKKIDTVVPGILHWSLLDDRIHAVSNAHAVVDGGRSVLIDPLPLEESALRDLGTVEAICLTGSCHQRSAWRFRKRFGAKVYAPKGAVGLDERPDVEYQAGDLLPGGLQVVHAPGPTEVHYAFFLERDSGALFCADVLTHDGKKIRFVPDEYQDDPKRTRRTAKKFLNLKFGALLFDHGPPITKDPHAAIREAIASDAAAK
jgi:glyoxylase-like metal-dependent hydrolase (beta-lactamase superfamily II)